ncbi:MAG: hypothetical protein J6S67_00495 [Methanobrevibacter sp.]|nr:hypothetical protein [Methanobrevibacter sp.]
MRFSLSELLNAGSHKWKESEVDSVTLKNLEDLCRKINALGYTPPMYASSCLRSLADQKRINPKAMGSSHLYGCSVDVADPDGKLAKWVKANKKKLEECGLWVENPEKTPGWVHFQTLAPKSMNRFFNP